MGFCDWANINDRNRIYHDTEWGIPVHDDRMMFEHLTLECLQCGLSWDLMLKKREIFRECFANFDYDKIAEFTEEDMERILNTEGMLHAIRKIRAVVNNARCYQKVREEFGSFCDYIWSFCGGKSIIYHGHEKGMVPTKNELSEKLSKDLKKRGFKFVGPVNIYSHLQACGIINDHSDDCPCFRELSEKYPTVWVAMGTEVEALGTEVEALGTEVKPQGTEVKPLGTEVFRKSTVPDIDQMVVIAEEGKALLKSKGISQWQRGTYPDRALFLQDVEDGIGYVLADGDEVLAICAVTFTDEESYRHLETGEWLTSDDAKYATIHRGAVSRRHQGKNLSGKMFAEIEKMAKREHAVSLRADTHPDNVSMNRSLQRAGFVKCGEFYILEGDEAGDLRYGYEKLI